MSKPHQRGRMFVPVRRLRAPSSFRSEVDALLDCESPPPPPQPAISTAAHASSTASSPRSPVWRPQGDSNPRCRRERAVSWASRRWGRRKNQLGRGLGGADRDRTDDLLNAIQALSQLSYSPTRGARLYVALAGVSTIRAATEGYELARRQGIVLSRQQTSPGCVRLCRYVRALGRCAGALSPDRAVRPLHQSVATPRHPKRRRAVAALLCRARRQQSHRCLREPRARPVRTTASAA